MKKTDIDFLAKTFEIEVAKLFTEIFEIGRGATRIILFKKKETINPRSTNSTNKMYKSY